MDEAKIDTVRLDLTQTEDATGKPISRGYFEWYSMDRNIANALSLELVKGAVDRIDGLSQVKAEVTASPEVKKMIDAAKAARKS